VGAISRVVASLAAVSAVQWFSAGAGYPAIVIDSLLVRVYDGVGVDDAVRKRAFAQAGDIMARAEIEVAWMPCPRGIRRATCDQPTTAGEIVVRLVRASAQADLERPGALGYSLVDSSTRQGTLATVFTDRIDRLAVHGKADAGALLGRAIAHELGHLILGTNEHSHTGLMRELWTADEIRRNRADDWQFTTIQREGLQAARYAGSAAARGRTAAGTGGQNPRTLLDKTP
jgi:hypothetical protein